MGCVALRERGPARAEQFVMRSVTRSSKVSAPSFSHSLLRKFSRYVAQRFHSSRYTLCLFFCSSAGGSHRARCLAKPSGRHFRQPAAFYPRASAHSEWAYPDTFWVSHSCRESAGCGVSAKLNREWRSLTSHAELLAALAHLPCSGQQTRPSLHWALT